VATVTERLQPRATAAAAWEPWGSFRQVTSSGSFLQVTSSAVGAITRDLLTRVFGMTFSINYFQLIENVNCFQLKTVRGQRNFTFILVDRSFFLIDWKLNGDDRAHTSSSVHAFIDLAVKRHG
jgi:hypothetical protein